MMNKIRQLTRFASSKKGSLIVISIWLAALIILTVFAPSSKEHAENSGEGSVREDSPSEIAHELLEEHFPSQEGMSALYVFHRQAGLTEDDRERFNQLSEWLQSDDKPEEITDALPFHEFPVEMQDQMYSEDGTTLLFNISLASELESDEIEMILDEVHDKALSVGLTDLQIEVTGPAGIAQDTLTLFRNADFILMIATILIIFILLMLVYRSPILAVTPLVIAAIVYGVADRVIGILGGADLFTIDSQATSIMIVLLFAVITDYSLFVFSRYKEQLYRQESKYRSMQEAMTYLAEPIFFSGGTILLAMLTLFSMTFKTYYNFAPIFSVAVVIILLAGLTLIPSVFSVMGRRAFWPSIPKVNESNHEKASMWKKIARIVTKKPKTIAISLITIFLVGAIYAPTMNFSFNLLKSFPDDMSSRIGFELLEDHYQPGQLAPVTILLELDDKSLTDDELKTSINKLIDRLEDEDGVDAVTSPYLHGMEELNPKNRSDNKQYISFNFTLASNPYEMDSIQTIDHIRENSDQLIEATSFKEIHLAGQTVDLLDVREINKRDMIVLFIVVTLLMIAVLRFQAGSFKLSLLMTGTILLSYVASLGFAWFLFKTVLGLDAISYRLPVYTFIFMVALGIDYNIMLVSRIREIAKSKPWKEAVFDGVHLTGGVISSAGIILAATFAVLMTQPLQELYLFGFTMAMGILLDTFIIRGFLMPSLLLTLFKNNK